MSGLCCKASGRNSLRHEGIHLHWCEGVTFASCRCTRSADSADDTGSAQALLYTPPRLRPRPSIHASSSSFMPPPQPTPQSSPPPPPFEPFRFKSVEPIRLTSPLERRGLLETCG